MQREIKKRLPIYGLAAVLLAIVLGTLCYNFGVNPIFPVNPETSPLKTFSSYEELRNFLKTNSKSQGYWYYYRGQFYYGDTLSGIFLGGTEYSTTNVQVAEIDEADIVKTDGEFIYLIANNTVFILKAYPPEEASIVSKITFNTDEHPSGIFVSSNGDKLAVLGTKYTSSPYYMYSYDVKTFIKIYDVSNKTNPIQTRNFMMSGSYFNSRMIGEYVYAIISQPAYVIYDTVILPKIYSENKIMDIEASRIHYFNVSEECYTFTTAVALNMLNDGEEPNTLTVMMGGTSTMYMSLNNIYITFHKWNEQTSIYRIRVENRTLICEAQREVPGRELNQFSMDEYNGYFRIATTTWTNGTNLYVLNMNLSVVGKLENLAPKEYFHSARFMGERCYLVTFKKVDPLFVIDLSDPTNPEKLGELKIPGYSDYLHPYDENHIIGVGKETVEATEGNFAWYQGIKISLFDVTDVNNPRQIANYTIGDRGSDSPVLSDHKAFLFDKAKNLLVIPVLVAKINQSMYPEGVPSWVSGDFVGQGAFVFDVSLEDGFVLKGNVTHLENGMSVRNVYYHVKRSLYIGNILYTVSERKVKINTIEDLEFVNEVELS
ncbi:MAG: beta-propeller domain-containing protein [Candidatus Bathyarchaeia archaeon]